MMYVLRKAQLCASLTTLFLLIGCQSNVATLPQASANAVETTASYDAVVELIMPGGQGLCSATFISPNAVLTAAHCAQLSGEYTFITSFGTFTTSNVQTFSGAPLTDAVDDPNDVAILWFNTPVATASLGQVYNIGNSVDVGETLRLVGYGCDNFDTHVGTGVLRTGTNLVYSIDDYINFMTPVNSADYANALVGPDNLAGSCAGDSGGPALYQDGQGNYWIEAITHAGGYYNSTEIQSEYVNVATNSDNRAFVSQLNGQYNLGIVGF
jgi:secreted trypsin-like serine protease